MSYRELDSCTAPQLGNLRLNKANLHHALAHSSATGARLLSSTFQ